MSTAAVPASVTPPPPDSTTTTTTTSASVIPGVAENPNVKSRLQEFTQKASIPIPVYETLYVNGPCHLPQFRSSVTVDGETYTSNICFNKKAAERDAARVALEEISKKIKDCVSKKTTISGFPPIFKDKIFCKAILNEFAAKMNMEKPNYESVRTEGKVPVYITSVIFNGVKYVGAPGVNKKEAEQLAARNAILSILADSGLGMQLSQIVKSKAKLFSVVHGDTHVNEVSSVPSVQPLVGAALDTSAVKGDCQGSQNGSATENVVVSVVLEPSLSRKSDLEGADGAGNVSGNVVSHIVPKHEFRMPGVETLSQAVPLPIAFVPSLGEQTPLIASGQKRKKPKKKKKANKIAKIEETQVSELPLSQGMS